MSRSYVTWFITPIWKRRYSDEIAIIGPTGSCHYENLQCSQRWKPDENNEHFAQITQYERKKVKTFLRIRTHKWHSTSRLPGQAMGHPPEFSEKNINAYTYIVIYRESTVLGNAFEKQWQQAEKCILQNIEIWRLPHQKQAPQAGTSKPQSTEYYESQLLILPETTVSGAKGHTCH